MFAGAFPWGCHLGLVLHVRDSWGEGGSLSTVSDGVLP